MNVQFKLEQVPPPDHAPIHQIGETLGLCAGLRAERSDSQYRCSNCNKMQPAGSWLVWVPDGVRAGDPEWSVTESARVNAWNGHLSGWCVKCSPKASKKPIQGAAEPSRKWWQFWR